VLVEQSFSESLDGLVMNVRKAKHSRPPLQPSPSQQGEARADSDTEMASDLLAVETEEPGSAEALATLDRSGWPPHPAERRDFYHRIRAFPPEVSAWRRRMLRHLADNPLRFPLASTITPRFAEPSRGRA
jgi:hypothetical protein